MYGVGKSMYALIAVACLFSAVFGWVVIESFIWLFSHISFNF